MSAKYTFAVYETIVGSAKEKLVLLKLADNANDQGICWPGFEYLVKHTELSRSSLLRALKSLEEKKFIQVRRRKTEDKKQNLSNVYQLTLPSVTVTLPQYQDDTTPSVNVTPEPNNNKSNNESTVTSADALAHKIIDLWNDIKATQNTNWQSVDIRSKKRITLTKQRIKQVSQRMDEPNDKKIWSWFSEFMIAMANDAWYSGRQTGYKLEYGQFMAEDYFIKTIERLNER